MDAILTLLLWLVPPAQANLSGTDYTASVSLPTCTDDATTRIINTAGELTNANLNGSHTNYCLDLLDYTGQGTITITADGTEETNRVIRLNTASATHPANASVGDRAILSSLVFDNADHWTIEGVSIDGEDTVNTGINLTNGSTDNTFNRVLIYDTDASGFSIGNLSDNNRIQNSVIRESFVSGVDTVGIALATGTASGTITGTIIAANEIYDYGDGIQLVVSSGLSAGSTYPDTVIADNDIYDTTARYTDCEGNYTVSGYCSVDENGIDIKGAGTGASDYVKVLDNRVWGYRLTDTTIGASGSAGPAITLSTLAKEYVLIRFNIIGDSRRGISMTAIDNNISIVDNIIYDTEQWSIVGYADQTEIYRNTMIDSNVGLALLDATDYDAKCNVSINAPGTSSGTRTNAEADYNQWYPTASLALPGENDTVIPLVTNQLCYDRKLITGSENVCIASGAYRNNICNYDFTSRSGIGVNNLDWTLGPN